MKSLQQDASNKLGMTAKKTMSIAQKLYEGIELPGETVGLITYMRTDSIRLSNDFINDTYQFIKNKFGSNYVGSVKVSKKTENVQDAHEAIRPTSINRIPEEIKPYLTPDEYKLYRMIYYRALASLMKSAKYMQTSINLSNNGYNFKANGSVITFDGYLKVYKEYEDVNDVVLPDFKDYKSKVIVSSDITKEQHFTKPPSRYTEAKLIKEMEEIKDIKSVKYNLQGRLIYIIMEVANDTALEVSKGYANKTLSYFTAEQKEYYDIQVLIKSDSEESEVYPIIGAKHKTSTAFIWTENKKKETK